MLHPPPHRFIGEVKINQQRKVDGGVVDVEFHDGICEYCVEKQGNRKTKGVRPTLL